MKEIIGDIWKFHAEGNWIVITTNGIVKSNGEAVMGKGIALQAKQRFPVLPKRLGELLKHGGNHVYIMWGLGLITLPTKNHWRDLSIPTLIERGCEELQSARHRIDRSQKDIGPGSRQLETIYMVRPGCSNGGLDWKNVKPILEKYLDDRFVVVEKV